MMGLGRAPGSAQGVEGPVDREAVQPVLPPSPTAGRGDFDSSEMSLASGFVTVGLKRRGNPDDGRPHLGRHFALTGDSMPPEPPETANERARVLQEHLVRTAYALHFTAADLAAQHARRADLQAPTQKTARTCAG